VSPSHLDLDEQVAAIRTEGARFWDTIERASDLDVRVPSCPDWCLRDLAVHLCEVHWWWKMIVEQGITDLEQVNEDPPTQPLDQSAFVELGRDMLEWMVSVLGSSDQDRLVYSWVDNGTVGFVTRHQVQEAAVHRWDAQNAVGSKPDPIDREAGVDAIDEFLTVSRPAFVDDAPPLPGSVHVHCTDAEGEWIVHPAGDVEAIHAKGDAALRGTASDLLLALYRRIPLDQLELIGDRAAAAALVSIQFE
jgi:uncharacterized protein (TIGR03083 family)